MTKAGGSIQTFSESTHIEALIKACKMMKIKKKSYLYNPRGQRSAGTNPAPPGGHSGFWFLLYLFFLSLLLSFAARNTNQIKIFCVTVMCLCDTPIFRSVPPSPSPPHQLLVPPRRSLGSHPDLGSFG